VYIYLRNRGVAPAYLPDSKQFSASPPANPQKTAKMQKKMQSIQ